MSESDWHTANREQTKALNAALAEAQAEFEPIQRTKRVTVETKTGARFSYNYAPLEAILSVCRPTLAKHGLALVQLLEDDGRGPSLRTELRHKGGGMVAATFPLPRAPEDPQALGSMLTYLRRYAVTAILGIATEEDDDGAGAKPKAKAKPKPKPADTAFEPPGPKPDPELGPLVTEVQHRFDTLRKLEAQLEVADPRDWTAWVRRQVGLEGNEVGTADHYRKAVEILGQEEARLIGEIARRTEQG